jgi:hypothetical protein
MPSTSDTLGRCVLTLYGLVGTVMIILLIRIKLYKFRIVLTKPNWDYFGLIFNQKGDITTLLITKRPLSYIPTDLELEI